MSNEGIFAALFFICIYLEQHRAIREFLCVEDFSQIAEGCVSSFFFFTEFLDLLVEREQLRVSRDGLTYRISARESRVQV